jgi:hypothetical protein
MKTIIQPRKKTCSACRQSKAAAEFYTRGRRLMPICKACHTERAKKARAKKAAPPPLEIFETSEGRRLASIKDASRYGNFSISKCYHLINDKRIKAYKLDKRTYVDLDSIDVMWNSLPDAADAIKANKHVA